MQCFADLLVILIAAYRQGNFSAVLRKLPHPRLTRPFNNSQTWDKSLSPSIAINWDKVSSNAMFKWVVWVSSRRTGPADLAQLTADSLIHNYTCVTTTWRHHCPGLQHCWHVIVGMSLLWWCDLDSEARHVVLSWVMMMTQVSDVVYLAWSKEENRGRK